MKITDYDTYSKSPFELEGIKSRTITKKPDVELAANLNTGEIYELQKTSTCKTYLHDSLPFTKVYHTSLNSVKDFSIPTLKVWCYILQYLGMKENFIILHVVSLKEFTGYATTPNIYKGIASLLEKGFIARATGYSSKYWINPNLMFNGKRTN
jgi:hypothetical protein